MRIYTILIIILAVVAGGLFVYHTEAHGNITVYSYGSEYIIWEVGGNTIIWLDGVETDVYGLTYGQYDLEPNTEHIACNIDGNCTGIVTTKDNWSVFLGVLGYWGVFFILIGLCMVSYRYPITAFPSVVYGLWMFGIYLPSISAEYLEYALVAVLIIVSLVAARAGWSNV